MVVSSSLYHFYLTLSYETFLINGDRCSISYLRNSICHLFYTKTFLFSNFKYVSISFSVFHNECTE